MNLIRLKLLLKKYKEDDLTEEECQELRTALMDEQYEDMVKEDILSTCKAFLKHRDWSPENEEAVWQGIVSKKEFTHEGEVHFYTEKNNSRFVWTKWAAAAIFILCFGIAIYFGTRPNDMEPVVTVQKPVAIPDVAPPSGTFAVITLGNGQQIVLDSVAPGTLTTQGTVRLRKNADGQIAYSGNTTELVYNSLFNPRGSRVINMVLADGTKIWLNSESTLRYPTAFPGKERVVEIIGEAYFEVAKDPSRKFVVTCNGTRTEVLGTHFNFNGYNDEIHAKITLLEGKVRVMKGNHQQLLLPGQQAEVGSEIVWHKKVDTDKVMAWKNGKFLFGDGMDIRAIMRQISRWYNVEVEYQGDVKGEVAGTISRNVNASQVFKILEMTGSVRFRTEGKKIVVMQ